MTLPSAFTPKQLVVLADAHIDRFTKMLESGSPMVRPDECTMYLGLWRSIRGKVETDEGRQSVTQDEFDELHMATDSGDYDDLLEANK